MSEPLVALSQELPPPFEFDPQYRRATKRLVRLTAEEKILAVTNALRYVPVNHHEVMAAEFFQELEEHGRIYGYRYRPAGRIWGRPVNDYQGILEARALQVNIDNNLDFEVALYPYELVTYGETGQVCQNWMQYRLIQTYLQILKENQTLVVQSGHPLGIFTSGRNAPRVVATNAAMVGLWDNPDGFAKAAALGCSNYGQMTAGGWIYIGPQGIVHGTYLTLLNAARLYLGLAGDQNLAGITFVSSGLGGMSGAQAKAIEMAGGIGVIAEVDYSRIETRRQQGWVSLVSDSLEQVASWMAEFQKKRQPISIAYHGNIVTLLAHFANNNIKVDLLSDQTSCHAVYEGGYIPEGYSLTEARKLLETDSVEFKKKVNDSLANHFHFLKILVSRGAHFWDYGNSFMISVLQAGVLEIAKNKTDSSAGFIWPSYVEDIMGPLCFDRGFGPFRWVCSSGSEADLALTDAVAAKCIDPDDSSLHRDNYRWIKEAGANNLVVGTKCRILYADEKGRVEIAMRFNNLVRQGKIGPLVIGRDHHDTMGTDSPYRETANIKDGSMYTADMAEQNFAGNVRHGMTLCVRSDGGGVGVGRAVNCGYALVLDGSLRVDEIIKRGVSFDVIGGVARRSWARNPNALTVAEQWNSQHRDGHITLPALVKEGLVEALLSK